MFRIHTPIISFPIVIAVALLTLVQSFELAGAATKEDTLKKIESILKDSMLPQSAHGSILQATRERHKGIISYAIVNPGRLSPNSVNQVSLFPREGETFDFSIFLANDDGTQPDREPDWAKLETQWDAFVTRYWPNMKLERIDDWRREILRYRANRGLFTIQYALKQQDVQVFRVGLDIRLADGKIGGMNTQGAHYINLFKGKILLPPTENQVLLTAFESALREQRSKGVAWPEFDSLSIKRTWRRGSHIGDKVMFSTNVELRGQTLDKKPFVISGTYFEKNGQELDGKVENLSIIAESELQQMQQKPFTRVLDSDPAWSSDGKQLLFTTTRDYKGRPWWNRAAVVYVPSIASYNREDKQVSLIRSIKPQGRDNQSYSLPSPSPSGRYLAATLPTSNDKLFILDMHKGIVYLPQRDPSWGLELQKKHNLPTQAVPQGPHWSIQSARWLSDESGLVLAMYGDWSDLDLYLIKRDPTKPPYEWNVYPIAAGQGDDTLPSLSLQDKRLAWASKAHNTLPKGVDNQQLQPERWSFVVAEFDASTGALSSRRMLPLPSKPQSLSWDNQAKRWLVVIQGGMLWVAEQGGKLQVTRVPTLKWKSLALKPTSADVAPQGGKIVVAAELPTPQVYNKGECIVSETIFLWDGQSAQVEPLFDLSLNGIPRFVFPATSSTWANVVGDVKKFGLENVVDPAYLSPAKLP